MSSPKVSIAQLESVVVDSTYDMLSTQSKVTTQASSSSLKNSNYSLGGLLTSAGQSITGIKNSFNYAAQGVSPSSQKRFVGQGSATFSSRKNSSSWFSSSSKRPSIEDEDLTRAGKMV